MWPIKEWLRISVVLCTFGFFREMRPSEPFVFEFLSGEWRNVTAEQVNRELYPMGTYLYLGQLVIVFLVTDILRYKPIIVLSALAGITLWALQLWTYTFEELIIVQCFFGTFMAAEVAYYTYIYAKVDREKYQIVTGHTRSAILAGKFLAGVLGQILVSFSLMDLRELNYISFGTQIASLLFALMLPSVQASLYFYTLPTKGDDSTPTSNYPSTIDLNRPQQTTDVGVNSNYSNVESNRKGQQNYPIAQNSPKRDPNNYQVGGWDETPSRLGMVVRDGDGGSTGGGKLENLKPQFSWQRAYQLLWQHFLAAYTNSVVLQWSLWWALAMAGYLQIVSYGQLLWKEIDPHNENFYNGGVEAAMTLFSALGAFMAGFLDSQRYRKWDLLILTVCSVIESVLIVISAATSSIWVAYAMYILFGILYNFMVTVASATVAKKIHEDSFALIFGINTVVALIVQTILTVLIVSEDGFALSPKGQYYAFAGYFLGLSSIYAVTGVVQYVSRRKGGRDNK